MPPDGTTPSPQVPALRRLFADLGTGLAAHRRYDEAAAEFDRALHEPGDRPSDGRLNELAALAYEEGGNRPKAWHRYLAAILAEPDRALALVPRVRPLTDGVDREGRTALLRDQRWTDVLDSTAVSRPARGAIATLVGDAARLSGDLAQAEVMYRRAVVLGHGRADGWSGLGSVLAGTGRPEEALKAFRTARDTAERAGDLETAELAALGIAEALVLTGRSAEALDACPADLPANPGLALRREVVRSRALLAIGRLDDALEVVRAAKSLNVRSIEIVLLEALALIALHRNEDAIEILGQALDRDPSHARLQFRLIQARMEKQQDMEKQRDIAILRAHLAEYLSDPAERVALLDDPTWQGRLNDGRAQFFRAYLYAAVGDVDAALAAAERTLKLGLDEGLPEFPEAPLRLLRAELLHAKRDEPAACDARFEAGRDYYYRGELETAVELFDEVLREDPTHRPTPWYLADALCVRADQAHPRKAGTDSEHERLTRRADAVWNAAFSEGPPDADDDWAYIVRASINHQMQRFAAAPRDELIWSSVAYLECALLRQEWLQRAWLWLSRCYRDLDQVRSARAVVERLRSWYPEDLNVLEEVILFLSNIGAYDEANEAVAERQRVLTSVASDDLASQQVWHRSVQAFCAFGNGQYEQARDLSERAIVEAADISPWVYEVAGRARRMLGDVAGALERFTTLLERTDAEDMDERPQVAWALLETDHTHEALQLFEDLTKRPTSESGQIGDIGIAIAWLQLGDLAAGERELAGAILRAPHFGVLGDIDYGLRLICDHTGPTEDLAAVATRLRDLVEQRRSALMVKTDDDDGHAISRAELERALVLADQRPAEQRSWMRSAALAGLARAAADGGDWERAATHYAELATDPAAFPEAETGLGRAVAGLDRLAEERAAADPAAAGELLSRASQLARLAGQPKRDRAVPVAAVADAVLRGGDTTTAVHLYDEALRYVDDSSADDLLATLLARSSAALYRAGEGDAGTERLLHAVALAGDPDKAAGELADAVEPVLASVRDYWSLDESWRAAMASTAGRGVAVLALGRRRMVNALAKLVGLTGQGREYSPWAYQVILELGAGLIPEDTSDDNWILFSQYIPDLKERIRASTGITVPGVWGRPYESHGDGHYRILIEESQVADGEVMLGRRFVTATPAVSGGSKSPPATPGTDEYGRAGWWVADSADVGTEPLLMVVRHLEAALHRSLPRLVGYEAVINMLTALDTGDAALPEGPLPGVPQRVRLGRILRALAADQVPVNDLWTIIRVVVSGGGERSEAEIIDAARAALRPVLPGNRPGDVLLRLPLDLADTPDAADDEHDVPSGEARQVLAFLRDTLQGETGSGRVLVARSARGRRTLVGLITPAFPDLAVVAEDELLDATERPGPWQGDS